MKEKLHTLNVSDHQIAALGYNEDKTGIPIICIQGVLDSVRF